MLFNMEDIKILTSFEIASNTTDCYYKDQINPYSLYNKNITGKGFTCAVIDTGCDKNHVSLKNKIIGGRNFTGTGDKNDFRDVNGHGTHVAGLISSDPYKQFNGGMAPGAKLLICKALGNDGSGSMQALIDSINYAVDQKVDIINMSLGGRSNIPQLYDAVKRAHDANIIICCASGNEAKGDGGTVDEFCYPGAYGEVIEVGAINKQMKPSTFSNSNNLVDCVCYGERILSCYPGNNYALLDGTSQATPLVSGCILLLAEWFTKEFGRRPTNDELYAALIKCSNTPLTGYNRKQIGFGYIDLGKI